MEAKINKKHLNILAILKGGATTELNFIKANVDHIKVTLNEALSAMELAEQDLKKQVTELKKENKKLQKQNQKLSELLISTSKDSGAFDQMLSELSN